MARDLNGRLRRRSCLASKEGRYFDVQMNVFMAYRNFVRPRFNGERQSPAQLPRFVAKRMTLTELISWRQDWGWFSVHSLNRRLSSIRHVRARERSQGLASHQLPDLAYIGV